jgi:hypothetical protein
MANKRKATTLETKISSAESSSSSSSSELDQIRQTERRGYKKPRVEPAMAATTTTGNAMDSESIPTESKEPRSSSSSSSSSSQQDCANVSVGHGYVAGSYSLTISAHSPPAQLKKALQIHLANVEHFLIEKADEGQIRVEINILTHNDAHTALDGGVAGFGCLLLTDVASLAELKAWREKNCVEMTFYRLGLNRLLDKFRNNIQFVNFVKPPSQGRAGNGLVTASTYSAV